MYTKRLKHILGVLVLLLLLDCIYIGYVYRSNYVGTSAGEVVAPVIYTSGRMKKLEELERQDLILSLAQANIILNDVDIKKAIKETSVSNVTAQNIVLLKTHKTASSTLQNIILRYAILHNLTVAIPRYKASFLWPLPFHNDFIKKQSTIDRYNIFAHHATLNKEQIDSVMEKPVIYITILRDPVKLFRSAYKYYQLGSLCFSQPISLFMESENYETMKSTGKCARTKMPVRNLQSFDLGLASEGMDDLNSINSLIHAIDKTFHFVMITERFDESLLLLGKKLNWSLSDLVYFTQNAQEKTQGVTDDMTTEEKDSLDEKIRDFNKADDYLYKHFNNKLTALLAESFTEHELATKKRSLQQLQSDLLSDCVARQSSRSEEFLGSYKAFRPYGQHTVGYILRFSALQNVTCRLLALPELMVTHYLKAHAHAST